MSKVRAVFLGTPEFAVVSLREMLKDEHFEIVGVVTQPDRPSGRKLQMMSSPVKNLALANGLRVISPEKINQDMILQEIQKWGAEVAVVVAFGQILSQRFLDLFPFGAVNVHGSLLPRWRGAAPIQRALEAGDMETGVALQKIVKELNAGDVFGIRKLRVPIDMTARELHDQLAVLGANLLHVELMDYLRGNLTPVAQNPHLVTFAKKIDKSESVIDWKLDNKKVHNKIRALQLGPGAVTFWRGKRIKIHRTEFLQSEAGNKEPGEIVALGDEGVRVQCGRGVILLLEMQMEGKSKVSAADFCKGHSLQIGARFAMTAEDGNS